MPEKVGTPPLLGSADVPLGPGPTWHRPRVTVIPVVVSINMLSERGLAAEGHSWICKIFQVPDRNECYTWSMWPLIAFCMFHLSSGASPGAADFIPSL